MPDNGTLYPDYDGEDVPVDDSNDEHENQNVDLSPPKGKS